MEKVEKLDISVLFVEDEELLRAIYERILDKFVTKLYVAENGKEGLELYEKHRPDLIITDIMMPELDGFGFMEGLRGIPAAREVPVIVITAYGSVDRAVEAMKTGAVDFLEKPFDEAVLLERIHEALGIDKTNRESAARHAHASSRLSVLTPREREVMLLLVAGNTNKEIAAKLDLSTRTIETHRGRVMEKTGVQSVAELVELAISSGSYVPK